jgi:galactose mutarotase-like enzyme
MKIKREKVDNPTQLNIESIEIHNSNNFSFKFYTYGGYIHEVKIPINKQEDKTEDVLLGYGNIDRSFRVSWVFQYYSWKSCQ